MHVSVRRSPHPGHGSGGAFVIGSSTPAYSKTGVRREMIESWADEIPHDRIGTPADVAEAVAFLASDAAGCITGDNLSASRGVGIHTRP